MAFDRKTLKLRPLEERSHDLDNDVILSLEGVPSCGRFIEIARAMATAKENGSSVILMMGGHVVRSGVQRYIIDLLDRGYISCLSMNGSVMIHDFEFALIGQTTESVARYIKDGQFGLWKETGRINDIINRAYDAGLGMGKAVGRAISEGDFPYKEISILAAAHRLNVPAVVHVGIGYDIIHEHPNCNGAATGETSYRDFLVLAKIIEKLEGGVVMNFGSSVMAPEVFLKALSMARNAACQRKESIKSFTALVCDLHDLPEDFSREPDKSRPEYYFRPWKTMLVRTVADGGKAFYIKGRHSETIPELWTALGQAEKTSAKSGGERA